MKTTKYIFALVIALSCATGNLFAVDKSYYSSLDGKSGTALREALTNIVYTHHTTDVGYNWTFDGIDIVNGEILDIYSTCAWTSAKQGKSYSGICDGYNREHVVPQSLFNEVAPQKTDRHHLFLTDGQVNNLRSSYPFGETNVTTAFSGYSNGNKALGKLGASSSGFTGTVYEPDDEYKGDIARAIMYMAIRYATNNECRKYGGSSNSKPVTTWSNAMFSGSLSTNYGLSANAVAMYMKWHRADPPSAKEIARNNGVEVKQGNRNPFVDLPDLAEYLWGDHKTDAVNLSSLDLSTGGGAVATPYEITLNRNGAIQTLTCTGTYTLPTAGEETAACEGWPFVGWSTTTVDGTSAPTYTTSVSSATTLYAVYANTASSAPIHRAGETITWELVTDASSLQKDDILVLASNASGKTAGNISSQIMGTVTSTFSSGDSYATITSLGAETVELTLGGSSGAWTLTSSSGALGATAAKKLAWNSGTTTWSISISSGNATIQNGTSSYGKFLYNTGSPRFTTYTSDPSASMLLPQLYRKTTSGGSGGGSTTYKTSPTCGDPHTITLTNDGEATGGTFDASVSSAYAGATITLMAEPSAGYSFGSWSVTNNSTSATITVTDNLFTMPDANVTVSATFNALPTYNIRFYNNGTQIGTTQSIYAGGYPDIPSDPTACEGYTFVGWWTAELGETNTESKEWIEDFTVTGAQDYYAVFSKVEGGGVVESWEKTDLDYLSEEDIFVIVGNGTYALPNDATGIPSVVSVTISDDEITSDVANNLKWNLTGTIVDGGFTFYPNGDDSKWLYCNTTSGTGSNDNIRIGTGARKTWISSGTQLKTSDTYTARYLAIYNSSNWRSYNSSGQATTAITFYKYTTGGGSTTYYTTSPDCVECTNKVTLTKGTPSYGSFTLDKADGEYENCKAGGLVVTVSDITPAEDYQFSSITQTGIASGVTIDQDAKTVTYAKDVTGTSTINVLFEHKPTYTIRFYDGSTLLKEETVTEGKSATPPADPAGCEGYAFVGWWTSALATDNTSAETWITSFTATQNQDYYAVYSHTVTSAGGGTPTVLLSEGFDDEQNADLGAAIEASTFSNFSGETSKAFKGHGGLKFGSSSAFGYVTTKSLDLSSAFTVSLGVMRYGSDNTTVYVQVADDDDTKQEIATYSLSTSEYTTSELSFDAATDASAIKIGTSGSGKRAYIDNVVITSGGGGSSTTYYTSTTACCEDNLDKPIVTATPGNGKITLTWADVTGADHYTVSIGSGAGYTTECGSAASIGTITYNAGVNTCVITGLTNGLEYTTSVVANGTTICDSEADVDQATPMDCTPWDDPTLTYNSYTLTVGSAHATQTISGTQHGTPTFSSSNVSVLTVDPTTGEVTPVGAGTATITAHWEMTDDYCEKDVVSSPFTVSGPLTITFNANDGTDEPATKTQTVTYNVAATLAANTFSRTGYVFQGWATTAGGAKVHNDGASVTFTESTVLYAVWQINSHNVTFTPSITGATVTVNSSSTSPQSAEYGSTVTVVVTLAEHHTLYSIEVSNGASVTIKNNTGTFTMPDEDVTVTVTMAEEAKATVNWYVAGTPTAEEKYAGETLAGITSPDGDDVCDGKAFVGWTATADYNDASDAPADLFTDPTTKTMPAGGANYYAVFADAGTTGSGSGTLIAYDGSGKLTLEEIEGVTQSGLGTDYASGTHGVYILKFDNTDDYIQFNLPSVPTELSFGYKMVGGNSTSTMTIKECATADGTYTNVQAFTISGSQNSIGSFTTSNAFSQKYVRMVFTKGSNVGVGTITISGSGSSTTYSNYSTSCVECTYKVTLTKGEESHGTFTLDKANGEHNNCTSNFVVTVSGITPEAGYYCTGVTATGGANVEVTGPDGSGNYTITYTKENNITSTITANFAEMPTYTATFMNCGVAYGVAQTGYAGSSISAPAGTPEACEGYTFVGWVTSEQTAEATSHSETVTFPQTMPSNDITYHALYRRIEGGSGSTNVVLNTSAQYTNGQEAGSKEVGGVTFAFAIGGNSSNAPKYYSSGTSVRMYQNNTLTISSESTISAIEFVWGDTKSAGLDASEGEYNANSSGGSWSGSTTSVTFTAGSSGQQHIQTITVTIDGGGTPYYTTAPTCSGYIITVAEVSQGEGASDKKRCDEGGIVTITLTPNEGYECGGITTSPSVTPTGSGCTYTFTMPASDITVTPVFTPKTPRTFTFIIPTNGSCATTELSEGVWNTGVTLPTASVNSGCDPEYVFAGWATASVLETDVRPTLYKAGENYNGENLTLYAVYAQTTGGSGSGFTLSYTKDDITYYATARSGSNSYMGASTDVAEAAHFSVVTSNDKQFLCWHGTEDTYIYTGTSNNTNLSFTTNIASAANGWAVTETDATLKLQSNGNDRYFMFNTNQKDRFAAYAAEGELTKGDAGTTIYNSTPSCICTSVDITYNANGGTLADGCENVTGGDCERDWKLCDAPTRDGYLFTGWKDLSGNLYDAGATISDLKISLTLTAQWIPAPYTVLFDAGTGTCIESLTEASRGDGITLPKAEPSAACADDWTFIGWSESKITGEASTATIIGVAGIEYLPAANNTTLYAVYRRVDTDAATNDYTRVTSGTPAEGDYVIVVARSEESFGKLTYGTLNKGRLIFTKDYTELPNKITSPAAAEIWHFTYDAEGYAYLYNVNAGAYLASSGYNITYDANAGSAFVFTRDPGTYGDFQCLNNTASSADSYYLGANKEYDLIRYYGSSNIVSLYSVTLYQGSAGTRYYSTEPVCVECIDPEWSFALGTSVVKSKGSAPFTNTVNKGHESAGTVTYSSTNEAVATVNAATGEVTLVGTGTTTITLRLTRAMPYCAAVLQYELEVKEPAIEVVNVTADGEIIVEHDLEGTITLDLSEGHSVSTGTAANDLFFSKYFEAASNMKLFAIFNGTGHEVDLSHIRVRCNCTTAGTGVWPTKTGDLGYVELSNVSKLREQYPKMKIPSGTELIFWSNNKGSTSSTIANNTLLRECIEINIGDMKYSYSDMEAGEIPDWFCLGSYTTYNTTDADGNNQFIFNGDDSMILERYDEATGTWVAIDLFGAGTSEAPASTTGLVEQITDEYEINGETQALNDGTGFHAECAGNPIPLSTNRYMLIRKNSVLDGLKAVASNTTSFATLCSEWDGTPVGGAGTGSDAYCNSGDKFSDIGEYDYAENYTEWVEINDDQYTVVENTDGTVTVDFTGTLDLDARACQLLKIEVRDETDPTQVLATSEYKIPIVVKAGEVLTSAELFHGQGDKCATCDVAILGSATLTKAGDGTTNDMPTVRDIYVYGGGNLVIPSGTHYNAHDLILRTQVANDKLNMNVPNVQVSGSLTNQYGGGIRMQTRVGTTRFYQFAVPYVVRLEDVTFSDGTPAVYGEDFMIRYYDGEQRAATQLASNNWRNYEGTELYPGVGYTLAVAKKAGHEQRELIFPMAGASLVAGEPATKETTIHAWGDNSVRANHRGWNFLSNPYLTTYGEDNLYEDAGNKLTTGQLIPDMENPGWWVNDAGAIPYVTIINAKRDDYSQQRVELQELPPFTTFFVQVGNDATSAGDALSLTFDRDHRKSAPAYIRAEQKPSVARFGVLLSGNNAKDNCGMVIGENYSAAYDMQADLSKEFGSAYSLKLYTLQEDQMQMAFQATHPDSLNKPVPVGVRLPASAEYTFSIDRRYNLGAFAHIYLTDNITGQHTDLLEDTYSFAGTKQQNNTRFCLFVQMRKDVPTGTDNLLNGIYVVGRNGSVMLTGLPETATIYIYDMSGRMVLTRRTQGVTSVTYNMPAGVYQIRVQAEGANALLRTIVY